MTRQVLSFDEFEVDRARSELRRAGLPLKVDALVLDLLAHLASRAGDLVTHEELIEHVWGGRAVSDNVVTVCMAKLRKALGHQRQGRQFVLNVYGRGYRFVRPVRAVERGSIAPGPRPAAAPDMPPFVGRDVVMARLRSGVEAAQSGQGRVCALLGEPGIGKTRVAEALEKHALGAGLRVAWGRCRDLDQAPPFWPWVEVVRELLAAVTHARAQERLVRSFHELSRVLPELGAAPEQILEDSAARHRTFDAVARLLALAGQEVPWLIVIDDLHRADAASLELLAYLVDDIARLPVVIVATLRSTERAPSPSERRYTDYVLGHRNCERIELDRLSRADVSAYTAAVLGRSDETLAQAVFSKSEGNPFFMTELLRALAARAEKDPAAARQAQLPDAALDLIRQRVRGLDDDAHGVLRTAAVLGRDFDLALLSAVTGIDAATLLEHLDEALATDVVVASHEGTGRFAFGHELIRTVLYDELSTAERSAQHGRVAEALESCQRRGLTVAPGELAHHALSALPRGDVMHAVELAQRAAALALRAAAHADAAAIMLRALSALDLVREPAPAVRCHLHFDIAQCLRTFDGPESMVHMRKAVGLAREHKLGELLSLAGQAMARSPGIVMIADARDALEDALSILPETDHEQRARVLAHLSWCAPYCFDREQAESLVARALSHAEAADTRGALVAALRAQVHVGGGPCRPDVETQRLLAETDRLIAQEASPLYALWTHQAAMFRVVFAMQRGDRAALERALDVFERSTSDMQHAELLWHCARIRLIERLNRGPLQDLAAQLAALRERAATLQLFAYDQVCRHDMLVLLRHTMEPTQLAQLVPSPSLPAPEDPPAIVAMKLRAAVHLGFKDAARSGLLELSRRGLEKLPCDRDFLGVLNHLALTAVALNEQEPIAALLALLRPHAEYYAADIGIHCDGSVAYSLGLMTRMLGQRDEAIQLFEHAILRNEHFELPARAAESRYELAATLLRPGTAGNRKRARELLAKAHEAASALGLSVLRARANALSNEL